MIWVITYKGRPANLLRLYYLCRRDVKNLPHECPLPSYRMYLSGRIKKDCIVDFKEVTSQQWRNRPAGVEVEKFVRAE